MKRVREGDEVMCLKRVAIGLVPVPVSADAIGVHEEVRVEVTFHHVDCRINAAAGTTRGPVVTTSRAVRKLWIGHRSLQARDEDEPLTFDVYFLPDVGTVCIDSVGSSGDPPSAKDDEYLRVARETGTKLAHMEVKCGTSEILKLDLFRLITPANHVYNEQVYITGIQVSRINSAGRLEIIAMADLAGSYTASNS